MVNVADCTVGLLERQRSATPTLVSDSCREDFGQGRHFIFKEFIDPFRSTSMFGLFSSHTLQSLDSALCSAYLIRHHFPIDFWKILIKIYIYLLKILHKHLFLYPLRLVQGGGSVTTPIYPTSIPSPTFSIDAPLLLHVCHHPTSSFHFSTDAPLLLHVCYHFTPLTPFQTTLWHPYAIIVPVAQPRLYSI